MILAAAGLRHSRCQLCIAERTTQHKQSAGNPDSKCDKAVSGRALDEGGYDKNTGTNHVCNYKGRRAPQSKCPAQSLGSSPFFSNQFLLLRGSLFIYQLVESSHPVRKQEVCSIIFASSSGPLHPCDMDFRSTS